MIALICDCTSMRTSASIRRCFNANKHVVDAKERVVDANKHVVDAKNHVADAN